MSAMRTGVLLWLLLMGGLRASAKSVLTGTVRDSASGKPLVGASVVINGTEYGAATNTTGTYVVALPETTGTATAVGVGYGNASASFSTALTCTTHLDFCLHRIQAVAHSLSGSAGPPSVSLRPPDRSEIRLYEHGGDLADFERMLAITQVGDSVLIQHIGLRRAHRWREPSWDGPGMKERDMPISGFQAFWDSLNQLGFWHLEDQYSGKAVIMGEPSGYVCVRFQEGDEEQVSKTVRFSVPGSSPLEFGRVYNLLWKMVRFAQPVPDSLNHTH